MAILFDWYENPKTKDKQGEELTLHPRIKLNGSTTTDELRRHIRILLADRDGCTGGTRCFVAFCGTRAGGGQAGTFGRHRLLCSHADLHGTGDTGDKAEKY